MADEEKNEQNEDKNEEQPAEEQAPEAEAPADAPAGEAEDVAADDDEMEGLDWKARKRLERSRESGEAGPQRSPEDRAKERSEQQGRAAKSRSSYRKKARQGGENGTGTPPAEHEPAGRKERRGTVVSSKADKTITVRIDRVARHRVYGKVVRETGTLHVHDERNEANEGDVVRVTESRPLSRTKRWRLDQVLEKAR